MGFFCFPLYFCQVLPYIIPGPVFLGAYTFRIVMILGWNDSFIIMKCNFSCVVKFIIWYNRATLSFLMISVCMAYLFLLFYFQYMCLYISSLFYMQWIVRSYSFTQSENICLFIGAFKVYLVIDMIEFKAATLLFLICPIYYCLLFLVLLSLD